MAQNTDDIKLKSRQDADKAVDEYLRKLREIESDSTLDISKTVVPDSDYPTIVPPTGATTSTDAVTAPGYDPNYNIPSGNTSVPTSQPVNSRQNLSEGSMPKSPSEAPKDVQPSTYPDNRESAPDLGKDYGDGLGAPGYRQYPDSEQNKSHKSDDRADKRDEGMSSLPNQNQVDGNPKGLEKKDGLEDKQNKGLEDKNSKLNQPDSQKGDRKNSDQEDEFVPPMGPQNGYGALNNRKGSPQPGINDSTSRARRNLEHSNRVRQGEQGESPKNSKAKQSTPQKGAGVGNKAKVNANSGIGSKIKNKINNLGKGNGTSSTTEKKGQASDKFKAAVKKKILEFLAAHPFLVIVIGIILLFIIILIASNLENSASRGKGAHCTYNLSGVSASGEVKLEGLQVELINCDGTASNYTVLETVDFEKYVLGVALAEIGAESPDEAIKAQIVAARGFALTRNSGMCPGNQDGCFYGYNASTGKIRMRACEADQVYWDYEKDIYRQDRGSISIYSPEINTGTLWKTVLNESRKAHVLELANEVKGKVLIDSTKRVVSTNYVASVSQQFIDLANQGKDYEQILATVYTNSDGFSSGECTSYGNIDYGDYVLSSDGDEILHEPLDGFLRKNGTSIEEFNSLISSNVEKAGYGTRAGVVAAAVTLIAELGNNYDVKIPYFWGGGHADGVVDGSLSYWGSTQCHTYANNTSYNYCGLDCSGFVPWAVKNGGFNMSQMLAGDFKNLPGVRKVSLGNSPVIEPGDLLESSGHIVLVIGIEEASGSYICAEASGNSSGVLFTRRPFNSSGYWGVDMTGYYETHVRGN